jgi:GT2 family glycosyltransferase
MTDLSSVAVVVLNYNGKDYLNTYLPSVTKYSGNAQIIVADNGSTDGSVAFIHENYPNVKTIVLDKNYGICGGYNLALATVEAKYFVLLNSDVEVSPDWLVEMFNLLEKDKTIAVCQPKIKSYLDKSSFEYAGAAGGMIDYFGFPFCRGRIFNTVEKDEKQYNENAPIFWASGAAMFVNANVFKALGGLDADFFAHMEEIDFCWRVQNAGYKVFYCAKSTVYHLGGGTLHKSNPHKTFLNFRNCLLLLCKNLPSKVAIRIIVYRLHLDGIAGVHFLLSGYPRDTWAVVRAHFAFYQLLPRFIRKRKELKAIIKNDVYGTTYQKSIVWQYFILKKKTWKEID